MTLELQDSRRAWTGFIIVAVLACGALACSDQPRALPRGPIGSGDRISLRGGTGGAGGIGTARAGRGGTTGSPFDAGRADDAGPGPERPGTDVQSTGPTCAIDACRSPSAAIYACCLPDGSCGAGVNSECRALSQPGVIDPACPAHLGWDRTIEFAGCCRPNNRCGVEVSLGLGCVERSDLPSYLGGPLEALRCSSPETDDAGVDDAGADDGGR